LQEHGGLRVRKERIKGGEVPRAVSKSRNQHLASFLHVHIAKLAKQSKHSKPVKKPKGAQQFEHIETDPEEIKKAINAILEARQSYENTLLEMAESHIVLQHVIKAKFRELNALPKELDPAKKVFGEILALSQQQSEASLKVLNEVLNVLNVAAATAEESVRTGKLVIDLTK
jgi:hypothetical protein